MSFDRVVENISLTGEHRETAEARRAHLVSLLNKELTILDSFPTGSIPKGTALKSYADLDIIVVLHWEKHIKGRTPKQVLQAVRDALGEYKTNVRKNGQAVTRYYQSWPNVDIVPVSRSTNDDGSVNHYNVPDMNTGRWLQSRPRKHAKAIEGKAAECGAKFKPLIRMFKEWRGKPDPSLENWYPAVVAEAPLHIARMVCQRANLRWDGVLRRGYARWLIAVSSVASVAAIYASLAMSYSMEQVVLKVLAPLSPFLLWGLREAYRQKEAAGSLDRLKTAVEALWARAVRGEYDTTACETESRRFQDEIFDRRSASPLVFDWIYRRRRERLEREMSVGAADLIKTWNEQRRSGLG